MLPCCLRLLFNCISKAKIENSIVLCVAVNFPPPFSCSWFEGFNPCSEGECKSALQSSLSAESTDWGTGFWPVPGESYKERAYGFFLFRNTGTESTCPGTRVLSFGGRNTRVVDVHQKSGQSFLLFLPAK